MIHIRFVQLTERGRECITRPNHLSSKLNEQKSKLNEGAGILYAVAPRRRHKFRELLDWLEQEKGLNASQLAAKSGKFGKSAITYQLKSDEPNPGLDMIHGIAKVGGLPEQIVIDAFLGRAFPSKRELQKEALKELLRKYELIKPENRPKSLQDMLTALAQSIEETLEAQEHKNTKR